MGPVASSKMWNRSLTGISAMSGSQILRHREPCFIHLYINSFSNSFLFLSEEIRKRFCFSRKCMVMVASICINRWWPFAVTNTQVEVNVYVQRLKSIYQNRTKRAFHEDERIVSCSKNKQTRNGEVGKVSQNRKHEVKRTKNRTKERKMKNNLGGKKVFHCLEYKKIALKVK